MTTASTVVRFTSYAQVIEGLQRLPGQYDPRTSSFLRVRRGGGDPHSSAFRPGFIANFEERAELIRRLRLLDERAQALLVLWFAEDTPVTRIAERLNISRGHCYRLRNQALRAMIDSDVLMDTLQPLDM